MIARIYLQQTAIHGAVSSSVVTRKITCLLAAPEHTIRSSSLHTTGSSSFEFSHKHKSRALEGNISFDEHQPAQINISTYPLRRSSKCLQAASKTFLTRVRGPIEQRSELSPTGGKTVIVIFIVLISFTFNESVAAG